MNSQPITNNIPPSSTMGTAGSVQLPAPGLPAGRAGTRDGHSATSASAANAAQTNNTQGTQPMEPFEALLARQMSEASPSALLAPSSATVLDAKAAADSARSTSDHDSVSEAANISSDPSSALAAMIQIAQDIKMPATKDLSNHATPHGNLARSQPAVNVDATLARAKVDMTAFSDDRALATITATGEQIASSVSVLKTTPPEVTPSGISVAASPAMANMLASNKLTDTPKTITTLLGSNGWQEEFSQKISWLSTQQSHAATLYLNPPDLGPLEVVLNISDNQATALFTSPHSAVRDAIESALPKLRESLADNGIMLGNATVSDQPPRDRSTEGFMRQNPETATQHNDSGDLSNSATITPADSKNASVRRRIGMVDIFA